MSAIRFVFPAVALAAILSAGCSNEPTMGTVNGTVTMDGQPLADGTVSFIPTNGKTSTASGTVKDGKFTATVPVGEMQVKFSSSKVVGKKKMYDTPDSPTVDEMKEMVPDRYGVNSELKITVKKGSQDETFPLKSK